MPDDFQALPPPVPPSRPASYREHTPELPPADAPLSQQMACRPKPRERAISRAEVAVLILMVVVAGFIVFELLRNAGAKPGTMPARSNRVLQPAPVAAAAKDDSTRKDRDLLQGTWLAVGAEFGSKKLDDAQVPVHEFRYIFEGDMMWATSRGKDKDQGVHFTLDPGKTPKEIDFSADTESGKGIYALEGDTLKLCLAPPGVPRPDGFSKQKEGCASFVLKREKQ
jgi:uncharacterized protein (TIGR03067 family)